MSFEEIAEKHGLNESLVEFLRQGEDESLKDNSTVAEKMVSWEGKLVSVLLEQVCATCPPLSHVLVGIFVPSISAFWVLFAIFAEIPLKKATT
jgi:hypothetical protein